MGVAYKAANLTSKIASGNCSDRRRSSKYAATVRYRQFGWRFSMLKAVAISFPMLAYCAYANAESDHSATRSLYISMEADTKRSVLEVWDAAHDSRSPKVSKEQEAITRLLMVNSIYQRVIDTLSCAETYENSPTPHRDSLMNCIAQRAAATKDMEYFQRTHLEALVRSGLDKICAAKSSMTNLERKYPPYSFMQEMGAGYRALDAAVYLKCVKDRL